MEPSWRVDPADRFDKRWWDGNGFTAYVWNAGIGVALDTAGLKSIGSGYVSTDPRVLPEGAEQAEETAPPPLRRRSKTAAVPKCEGSG